MKKRNFKNVIAVIVVLMLLGIIAPQVSKAAVLQANPTTNSRSTKQELSYWPMSVREMETTGQAMGLTETINSTSALGKTESNGIDVHMMKSTEYGAMAILSASGFGNPANTKTIDTTTGNKTGVYMQTKTSEWVASRGVDSGVSSNLAKRYFNSYQSTTMTPKPGDALDLEWHKATIEGSRYGYYRGGTLGVFGCTGTSHYPSLGTRAVVVSGSGF